MSDTRDPDTDQVAPIVNDRPFIQDLVIADFEERKQFGIRKYGTALQAGNGRNALQDIYEELIDAVVYLRTELEERAEGQVPWELIDRDPELAAKILSKQAPETVRLLRSGLYDDQG